MPVDMAVFNVRQAHFVLLAEIANQLKRGIDGLPANLTRTFDISVSNAEEFKLIFGGL